MTPSEVYHSALHVMFHHMRILKISFDSSLQGGGFMDMFGMMGEMMGNVVSNSVNQVQTNRK